MTQSTEGRKIMASDSRTHQIKRRNACMGEEKTVT